MSMTNTVLRNTIGARNPYAVAELKLGKKINWDKKTLVQKVRLLEKAFGIPYDKLFDPRYSSSIFPLRKQKTFPKIMTGGSTLCTPNPCPTISPDNWSPVPNGKFIVTSAAYNDLIQGCLPDCYFIAALSAYSWAVLSNAEFRNNLTSNPYSYQFWSPQIDPQGNIILNVPPDKYPEPVKVDDSIPLITPDQKIFSRSYTPTETWPCIYEKAYAVWKYCKLNNLTPDKTIKPADYLPICVGNPLAALMEITGRTPIYFNTSDYSKKDDAGKLVYDGAKIHSLIGKQSKPDVISLQTNYPTVAWTYNPLDSSNPPPQDVTYKDDVIVANHSYTVLGVHPKVPVAGKNYIVLRNPWGQKCGDPTRGSDPNLGPDPFSDDPWTPIMKRFSDATDGIFAINADTFGKYFQGFGWVKY